MREMNPDERRIHVLELLLSEALGIIRASGVEVDISVMHRELWLYTPGPVGLDGRPL